MVDGVVRKAAVHRQDGGDLSLPADDRGRDRFEEVSVRMDEIEWLAPVRGQDAGRGGGAEGSEWMDPAGEARADPRLSDALTDRFAGATEDVLGDPKLSQCEGQVGCVHLLATMLRR